MCCVSAVLQKSFISSSTVQPQSSKLLRYFKCKPATILQTPFSSNRSSATILQTPSLLKYHSATILQNPPKFQNAFSHNPAKSSKTTMRILQDLGRLGLVHIGSWCLLSNIIYFIFFFTSVKPEICPIESKYSKINLCHFHHSYTVMT